MGEVGHMDLKIVWKSKHKGVARAVFAKEIHSR